MITIIDYGMGNLRSVQKAFEFLGYEACISEDPEVISKASHVILPGVGAFEEAISRLKSSGMDQALLEAVHDERPVLGICLGMQLMFQHSEENGYFDGLGLFPGTISPLPKKEGMKIPHMGWQSLKTRDCLLFRGNEDPDVYFVHSYAALQVNDFTTATCDYGQVFTAACERGRVCATQFHPEKSGEMGLRMLRRFAQMEV